MKKLFAILITVLFIFGGAQGLAVANLDINKMKCPCVDVCDLPAMVCPCEDAEEVRKQHGITDEQHDKAVEDYIKSLQEKMKQRSI